MARRTADEEVRDPVAAGSLLEARIAGSSAQRQALELLRNSGQFPIANLLLELLLEGPRIFLAPDIYVLLAAAIVQAWVLTREAGVRPGYRFFGNLAGPAAYTAVEWLSEGASFFSAPHHIAYWCFAAAIGALQWAGQRMQRPFWRGALAIAESTVRASILFVTYAIFEVLSRAEPFSAAGFFGDPSHVFIGAATLLLGLSAGVESHVAGGYLALLRDTSLRLKRYSQWLFGEELLERAMQDPTVLALARRDRGVLFMDIRGFTAWSEHRAPETVVEALGGYYAAAEAVLRRHGVLKLKFSADEVLAVFASARDSAACALALSHAAGSALAPWGLQAGIGVHFGPVVEGLVGSAGVKGYDVIGDTVNTAKRIEGAAGGGEVLLSAALVATLGDGVAAGPSRELAVKGKQAPIAVHPLVGLAAAG